MNHSVTPGRKTLSRLKNQGRWEHDAFLAKKQQQQKSLDGYFGQKVTKPSSEAG